jgi:hypothetical protein
MFKRGNVFYCEDRTTGQQKSLQTRDEEQAQRVIQSAQVVASAARSICSFGDSGNSIALKIGFLRV